MAGTKTRNQLSKENINAYIDILSEIINVLEDTKNETKSFARACKDRNLDAMKVRSRLQSLKSCKTDDIQTLSDLLVEDLDNYEAFYRAAGVGLWGFEDESIITFKTHLPTDYVETIDHVLSTLTDREETILRLYYGLDEENQRRTLHEIGCTYNVTRERINYIIHRALRKLRHPSRRNILKDGLTVYNMECEANRKLLSEKKQLIEETYERRKQDLLTMLDTPFNALMCLSMDMLDLSIRPRNCLRRHFQCDTNTVTIKDVLKLIEQDELQNVRNLGRRSYDEIIERMDKMLQTNCGTSLSIYLIDHRKKEEE